MTAELRSAAAHRLRNEIEARRVDELKANRFNAALFPDSLSDGSIALITEDLAEHGQRVPIEIAPDGTIIDGERRWRGAKQLGWETVDVIVRAELDDDALLDRVVACCTSSRQMTVREQANVYAAVRERLQREAGRQRGRPEKIIPKGIISLTTSGIRDAAAKRAGFTSATLALRAEAVFARGSEEIQAKVRDGSLTISAAYEGLPKRSKTRTAPEPDEESAATDDSDAQVGTPIGAVTSEPEPVPVAHFTLADVRAPVSEASRPAHNVTERERDPEVGNRSVLLVDPLEEEDHSIAAHVDAICRYVAQLADRDYDDAAAWFERVVDEMRTSLGDSPDSEAGGQSDDFEEYFEGALD